MTCGKNVLASGLDKSVWYVAAKSLAMCSALPVAEPYKINSGDGDGDDVDDDMVVLVWLLLVLEVDGQGVGRLIPSKKKKKTCGWVVCGGF